MFVVRERETLKPAIAAQLEPLYRYCRREIIENVKFLKTTDKWKTTTRYQTVERGQYLEFSGLCRWLKRRYYPNYKTSRRRFQKGQKAPETKASSSQRGKRVDRELSQILFDLSKAGQERRKRNGQRKRTLDKLTKGILLFWEKRGHILVATQLPVHLSRIRRMTEADVITLDKQTGQLHMWEIKTCGVGLKQVKGNFEAPYQHVKCTLYNQWELQRHYTHQGLEDGGLLLKASHVLHATEQRNGQISVIARPNADWINIAV